MGVFGNWNGVFVEDEQERRAYVTEQDAIDLAKHYKLNIRTTRTEMITAVIYFVLGLAVATAVHLIF